MLIRENIFKNGKVLKGWTRWAESKFNIEKSIIATLGGTSTLKAYCPTDWYLSNPLQNNIRYEVSLYIENLGHTDIRVYINGLDTSPIQISSGFSGNITISGNRIPNKKFLQLQLLTTKVDDDIKVYLDEILVSEYTNLISTDEISWNGFNGAVITKESEIVNATAGDKTSALKAYYHMNGKLIDSLIIDDEYTISFYFENLTGSKVWVKILGFKDSYKAVDAGFKGILTYTDKRIIADSGEPLQIQVSNPNIDEGVKFIVKYVYLYKTRDEKEERIWIPAKSDLPTNQKAYYPPERNYNELKAI